ncbi:hypothetical protein SJI00_04680 [Pseudomonas sp. RP23018S]|uniref:hypothetical protein n=1 Tax=Pseudomonas sp. RP23018S TaxID=3096037 RepID=UPI002ACB04EC|nr:hypothetical protein [Pseudomonas sp. RP23018S]MDZ5602076.1 hypothetical protein [Pseudomonas sp. RP23018S]
MSASTLGCGWLLGLALLCLAAAAPTQAVEVTLSARYQGDSAQRFEHTTPPASMCVFFPSMCRRRPSVTVPMGYSKDVKVSTVVRENFYAGVPLARKGWVYHEQSGEGHEVSLNFKVLSQHVASPNPSRNPAATSYRMAGNCQVQNGAWASSHEFVMQWNFDIKPGFCTTRPLYSSIGLREVVTVSEMGLSYILDLPGVYRLRPGRYRGSITYSMGAGGDFDFGDNVENLSDTEVTFNIELDVEHTFRVEFGPNSDLAVLEPPGGWTAWLDGGRIPPKIASDIPLRIWSSGPFRLYKLCEFAVGERCGLRNKRGEEVPLQVAVTLPRSIRYYQGWQSITRQPIPTGRAKALQLEGQVFTANGPGQVHFDVAQADLKPMLDRAGERYDGKVTVIFDAEL